MKRKKKKKDDLEIEPDSIIDTQTNVLYECNSGDMNELCKILNKQDNKWQKLKEWVKLQIDGLNEQLVDYDFDSDCREISIENFEIMLQQMQELEVEDVKD